MSQQVLDPNMKNAYAKDTWTPRYYKEGMLALRKKVIYLLLRILDLHLTSIVGQFDKYRIQSPPAAAPVVAESMTSMCFVLTQGIMSHSYYAVSNRAGLYGHTWMRNAVKSRVVSDAMHHSPYQELDDYLAAPLEDVTDLVAWWGQNSARYPTLARMAKDYLAVQGSSVASERAFSTAALTTTARRNCLLPETVEALQILKGGYRSGHISAAGQAARFVPRPHSPVILD